MIPQATKEINASFSSFFPPGIFINLCKEQKFSWVALGVSVQPMSALPLSIGTVLQVRRDEPQATFLYPMTLSPWAQLIGAAADTWP